MESGVVGAENYPDDVWGKKLTTFYSILTFLYDLLGG